jgi:HEAT repeat protein
MAPGKRAKAAAKSTGRSIAAKWMKVAKARGMTAQPPAARKSGAALWTLLEDPLPSVRQAAGFALASIRDPSIVQAFILELRNATSARAARAALTLGEAGFQNAAPYFIAAFSRDDRKASAAFARALGLLAEKSAAPLLIEALDDDFVPTEAAVALGQIGEASAIPALLRALAHRKDTVRAAAAYSLACLEGTADVEAGVRARLHELKTDSSRRVRLCAAVALFERGDATGLEAIRAALA